MRLAPLVLDKYAKIKCKSISVNRAAWNDRAVVELVNLPHAGGFCLFLRVLSDSNKMATEYYPSFEDAIAEDWGIAEIEYEESKPEKPGFFKSLFGKKRESAS